MYNSNTDSLGLILGVEVFFLLVTVQEHCDIPYDLFTWNMDLQHLCM